MSYTLHAVKTIAARRVRETFINPGFYITVTIGLIIGHVLVSGYASSVGSSGFTYDLNPVYHQILRTLSGLFGESFVDKLFAEGPYLFALLCAYLPMFLYLSLSSVFQFGNEKNTGAFELLLYGPSSNISFSLSFLVRDFLFSLITVLSLTLFFILTAVLSNLVLGERLFYFVVMLLFISLAIYAYGLCMSSVTSSPASSVTLFMGLLIFFILLQIGSFAITGEYVRSLSATIAWIVQWFSPFYYWSLGMRSVEYGNLILLFISLLSLIGLTALLLFMSHIVLSYRGVRES